MIDFFLEALVLGNNLQENWILWVTSLDLEKLFNGSVSCIPCIQFSPDILKKGTDNRALFSLEVDHQRLDFHVDLIFTVLYRAADDEGRSGLINQDAVHLVHNGIIEFPLHKVPEIVLHIVS